jgi:hypothetical protein
MPLKTQQLCLNQMKQKNLIIKTMKTTQLFAAITLSLLTGMQVFAQTLTAQVATQNPSCYGTNNGEVTIDIIGGTSPYSVNGLAIAGSQFVESNLSGGNFAFTITDASSASTSVDVTLVSPQPLNLMATVTNVTTAGGSNGAINLTVPSATVTYDWNTSNGAGLVPTSEDQTGLSVGIYNVTITDANGCQTSKRFDVLQQTFNPTSFMNFGLTPITQGVSGGSTTSSAISVYPNPSASHITLKSIQETKQAVIMNDMGIIVHQSAVNVAGAIEEVDLLPGAYTLIMIDTYGQKSTERIIVQ